MANKLELTWVGKNEKTNIEPRILIENKELSNIKMDKDTENMLIHGDNLLALKALEGKFAGKIKCIYIDPPFNTGSAFEHYDDNLEHSIWLDLMFKRLKILSTLLSNDGSIYVHIDNREEAYLKVIMDEIFGRNNFVQMISVKRATPAGFKVINPGPLTVTDYILLYAKNKNELTYYPQRIPVDYDENYDLIIENPEDNATEWKFKKLVDIIYEKNGFSDWKDAKNVWGSNWKKVRNSLLGDLALENAERVVSVRDPHKPSNLIKQKMVESKENGDRVIVIERKNYSPIYIYKGGSLSFYKDKLRKIDGIYTPTELLTDFWGDINFAGIAKEGNVQFKNSKKPEMLLRRIIELSTKQGDFVLDSFLGSGTTAAVAHKLNRKWIGVEMEEHCYSHCKPRLDKIIDGTDKTGISKNIGWQGGGGYRFYELAPTLINKDSFGEPVINKEYNAEMLASAVALHEGFKYNPSKEYFWKQCVGNENSYLYVTTKFVTKNDIIKIKEEMNDTEYLVIACTSYDKEIEGLYKNIKIKKIPEMLLSKCEFGKDNYNLNIITPLEYEEEYEEDE